MNDWQNYCGRQMESSYSPEQAFPPAAAYRIFAGQTAFGKGDNQFITTILCARRRRALSIGITNWKPGPHFELPNPMTYMKRFSNWSVPVKCAPLLRKTLMACTLAPAPARTNSSSCMGQTARSNAKHAANYL